MGDQTLTVRKAWNVYDHWLEDSRVEFYPEPRNLDTGFRQTTEPFAARQASKAIGDCFLLASAKELHATLVTYDRALHEFARKRGHAAVIVI
jgi:predicted nucleic acid-binding protein